MHVFNRKQVQAHFDLARSNWELNRDNCRLRGIPFSTPEPVNSIPGVGAVCPYCCMEVYPADELSTHQNGQCWGMAHR